MKVTIDIPWIKAMPEKPSEHGELYHVIMCVADDMMYRSAVEGSLTNAANPAKPDVKWRREI